MEYPVEIQARRKPAMEQMREIESVPKRTITAQCVEMVRGGTSAQARHGPCYGLKMKQKKRRPPSRQCAVLSG